VQVRVIENHQNGKDTHVRGLKIYARDERVGRGAAGVLGEEDVRKSKAVVRQSERSERGWIVEPDWMGEPELR
jgi:anaphase-promoting complex subunit 10